MAHHTTTDIREVRARRSGPASAGQRRLIGDLVASVAAGPTVERDLTFTEAGDLLDQLKTVDHWLSHRPKTPRIEVAAWATKAADAVDRRDREIKRAVESGDSLRAVAKAAGLSHQTVANIASRGQQVPPPR